MINQFKKIQLLKFSNEKNIKITVNAKTFKFLNRDKIFHRINWGFYDFGELWNYNLHYFDFLKQDELSEKNKLELIHDYIKNCNNKNRFRPYPTSIRIINWIKFLSISNIHDKDINEFLFDDVLYLSKNIEYHLMGNHVLENAFSLLFSSYYFKNKRLYNISKNILYKELDEQILSDGAHFELSTMYHQVILSKLLNCLELITNNNEWIEDRFLLDFLENKARYMIGWIDAISYYDGSIPTLNDSVKEIFNKKQNFFDYAKKINLNWSSIKLHSSGYRRWNKNKVQILIDVGQIGPSYIPGHAHADTFNFEFIYDSKAIIVDPGISTYDNITKRNNERSTMMHNTINIDNKNSSEIWAKFRVARRAEIISIDESDYSIKSSHNGYKHIGAIHQRSFDLNDSSFLINDNISFKKNSLSIQSNLHFHPERDVSINKNVITIDENIFINLIGYSNIKIIDYDYPVGFNKIIKSKKIVANVENLSSIEIKYEN